MHCPNTGAMTGCAEPGSRVWLSRSDSPKRRYPHTWELVETDSGIACIHSAKANAVVRDGLERAVINELAGYPEIRREYKFSDGSRADLLLSGEQGRVVVEVKAVTLCQSDGWGAFPDARSDRARRHARDLAEAIDRDTRSALVFCVFHSGITAVHPAAHIDPDYAAVLLQAQQAGLEILAYAADISPQGISLARRLPFTLSPGR